MTTMPRRLSTKGLYLRGLQSSPRDLDSSSNSPFASRGGQSSGDSSKGHKKGNYRHSIHQREDEALESGINYHFHCSTFVYSAGFGLFLLSMAYIAFLHYKYSPKAYPFHPDFFILSSSEKTQTLRTLFHFEFQDRLRQRMVHDVHRGHLPSDLDMAMTITSIYLQHKSNVNFLQIGSPQHDEYGDSDWKHWNDAMSKVIATSKHWHGVLMESNVDSYHEMRDRVEGMVHDQEHRILTLNAALHPKDSLLESIEHSIDVLKHKNIETKESPNSLTMESVLKRFSDSGKAARDGVIDVLLINKNEIDDQVLEEMVSDEMTKPLLVMCRGLRTDQDDMERVRRKMKEAGYGSYDGVTFVYLPNK